MALAERSRSSADSTMGRSEPVATIAPRMTSGLAAGRTGMRAARAMNAIGYEMRPCRRSRCMSARSAITW